MNSYIEFWMHKMQWIRNESIYCVLRSELRRSEGALKQLGYSKINKAICTKKKISNILLLKSLFVSSLGISWIASILRHASKVLQSQPGLDPCYKK